MTSQTMPWVSTKPSKFRFDARKVLNRTLYEGVHRVDHSENRQTSLFPSHLASARTTGASETKQHSRPGRADRQHHRGFVFACICRRTSAFVWWVLLPAAFVLSIVGMCLSGKSKGTSIRRGHHLDYWNSRWRCSFLRRCRRCLRRCLGRIKLSLSRSAARIVLPSNSISV